MVYAYPFTLPKDIVIHINTYYTLLHPVTNEHLVDSFHRSEKWPATNINPVGIGEIIAEDSFSNPWKAIKVGNLETMEEHIIYNILKTVFYLFGGCCR